MKNQASVLLQVVDSPINTTIPAGYLSIRAKSTGLVVVDSTGTETSIGSGGGGSEFTGVTLATTSGLTGNGTSNSGLGINWSSLYAGRPINFGYGSFGPQLTFDETTTDLKGTDGVSMISCASVSGISIGSSATTTTVPGTLDVTHFKINGTTVTTSNIVANPVKGYAAGYTLRILTQTAYDALSTKDSNTAYFIVG